MKKLLTVVLLLLCVQGFANHLKGGFFTYRYLGANSDSSKVRYQVTLTVYMDCGAGPQQIDNPINFTFFSGTSATVHTTRSVGISQDYFLAKGKDDACIEGDQAVCFYKIVVYNLPEIELPVNPAGYTVSYQRCCRIRNIINIAGNSASVGNTYTAFIPGVTTPAGGQNKSAAFQVNDTVVICRNNFFQYSFRATDPDGDSLAYTFCSAYTGASQGDPGPAQATAPPYGTVSYSAGFSGSSPLGSDVTINPQTGLMQGVAPAVVGEYVVTVCVNEYRKGVYLTTSRKELHISIKDCNAVQAVPAVFDVNGIKVEPNGTSCRSFTYTFNNDVPANPLVNSWYWEFSDGATYNIPAPAHTFADTGRYSLKLVVNRGQDCSDSLTTTVRVLPGFKTGFTHTGICINKGTQFRDTSTTLYGTVTNWRWDFGDEAATADTAFGVRNTAYTYSIPGTKNVRLIVQNSVGCVDTVRKPIEILTKPPLSVSFKDTLICNGDSLQLHAIGRGDFSWTPVNNILNQNTANPTVFPRATARYFVRLDDQGCIADDTVQVRVVDFVTLSVMADTTICQGDTMRLRAVTDGLRFLWDHPTTLNNPTLQNPTARPLDNPTTYTLTARIGPRCFATDDVVVRLTPYSLVNAGNDTAICYNTIAQLHGTTNGTFIGWSPSLGMTNASTLTPSVRLRTTTPYVLSATNNLGCITRDTVLVKVNREVIAFAGNDTAVVVGQTLQFEASGGVRYQWSPGTALNSAAIRNPKAVYDGGYDSIRYFLNVQDSIGCSDDATVLVKVFRTYPRIFVPTAFTPNGDGRNEYVAPIAVGMGKLDYFRIYNRWGQLVFETTINGKGWDGRIAGKEQGTSTYVWIVKGTDYTGRVVMEKGVVTLIR